MLVQCSTLNIISCPDSLFCEVGTLVSKGTLWGNLQETKGLGSSADENWRTLDLQKESKRAKKKSWNKILHDLSAKVEFFMELYRTLQVLLTRIGPRSADGATPKWFLRDGNESSMGLWVSRGWVDQGTDFGF